MSEKILTGHVYSLNDGTKIKHAIIKQNNSDNDAVGMKFGTFRMPIDENGKLSINIQAKGYETKNVRFYNNDKPQDFYLHETEIDYESETENLETETETKETQTENPITKTEIESITMPPDPPAKNATVIPSGNAGKRKVKTKKKDYTDIILLLVGIVTIAVTIYVFYKLLRNTTDTNGIQANTAGIPTENAGIPNATQANTTSIPAVTQVAASLETPSIPSSIRKIIKV